MPLCPRCRSEGEWESVSLDSVWGEIYYAFLERPPEDLLPLVEEEEYWKIPFIGDQYQQPPLSEGVQGIECSSCEVIFDPNEESLPIRELMEQLVEDDK